MPYRLDGNRNGDGVIIYVRENIPNKILTKHDLPEDIERIFLEINFVHMVIAWNLSASFSE